MDELCHICAQEVPGPNRKKIFAFGRCNHHVCYVCSARLRAICDQFECPTCRLRLEDVIFSENRKTSFKKFNKKDCLYSDKYRIYFDTIATKSAFDNLLKFECQTCLKALEKQEDSSADKGPSVTATANKKNTKPTRDKNKSPSNNTHGSNNDTTSATATSNSNANGNGNLTKSSRDRATASPFSTAKRLEEDGQGLLEPATVNCSVFNDVFGLKNHLNFVHKLRLCDLCLTHNKLFPFEYSYYDNATLRKHIKDGEPNTPHRGHPDCVLCHQTFFNNDELILHMSREHFSCHLCGNPESNMRIYFTNYDNLRNHFKEKHFLCERDNCRHEQFTSAFDSEIEYELHLVNVHGQQRSTITLQSTSHGARSNTSRSESLQTMRQNLPRNAAVISTGLMAIANSQRPNVNSNANAVQLSRPLLRTQRLPTESEFPALVQGASRNPSTATRPLDHPTSARPTAIRPNPSTLSQRLTAGSSGAYSLTSANLNEMDFPPLPEAPKPKMSAKKANSQKTNVQKSTAQKSGLKGRRRFG